MLTKLLTLAALALSLAASAPAHAGRLPVGGGVLPVHHTNLVGNYAAKGYGSLELHADGTFKHVGGCAAAGLPCFAITVQTGTYEVIDGLAPAFVHELVLTDEFDQVTEYRFLVGQDGAQLTLVSDEQTLVLDRVNN
jgi:hypothetical protein